MTQGFKGTQTGKPQILAHVAWKFDGFLQSDCKFEVNTQEALWSRDLSPIIDLLSYPLFNLKPLRVEAIISDRV
jgi:hypothetical protein